MAIAAILARRQQDDMSRNELEEAQRKEKFKVVFDAKEAREKAKKAKPEEEKGQEGQS